MHVFNAHDLHENSDELGRRIEMAQVIKLFDEERISLSHAAKLAGLSVSEMIDVLGQNGVAIIRPTEEDFERELVDFD